MKQITSFTKKHWRFISTVFITLLGTVFIVMFSGLSDSTRIFEIGIISFLLLLLLSYLLLSNNTTLDALAATIEKRGKLIYLLFAVIVGFVLVSVFTIQENLKIQEQINIANRDTAPSPIVTSESTESGTIYTITNEKGLILYSSFYVEEEYYFMVNNRGHEITFSFFDYQHEERTFTYSETEDGISLQTSDSILGGPKRNIGLAVFGPEEALNRIPDAVNSVLTMDPEQPSIDY